MALYQRKKRRKESLSTLSLWHYEARSQAKEGLKPTPTGDFPRLYAIHGFTKPYLPVAAYAGVNLFSPCLRQSQGRKE